MITTLVFDAYGTLFDVSAAAREAAAQPGQEAWADKWPALSEAWRLKQLQYSWLRAITGAYVPFWQVTKDALDWAMAREGLAEELELRERLLALYWELSAFHEVPKMLATLKAQGLKTAILSNGSRDMLEGAVDSAVIGDWLDAVLSVESVGTFKPASQVYDLVESHLGCTRDQVLFVSSNGWDAAGAANYGFQTVWVNRAGEPVDNLMARPHHILTDLTTLPELAR